MSLSQRKTKAVKPEFKRFLYTEIEWNQPIVIIKGHRVNSSIFGDFTIDDAITFEIGGPSKTSEQIRGIPNAYIAADEIKGGTGKKIPLWLFGFLY